jgi:hypothetical protein
MNANRNRRKTVFIIYRILYILEFIDDVELRQGVQKALNRGEAYHRLRGAVAFVNGGKFRVKTEAEQQLWNECSRLITNIIIYYNTSLLSRVYEQKQATGDQEAQAIIESVSPVAWQNVNLFGNFEISVRQSQKSTLIFSHRSINFDIFSSDMSNHLKTEDNFNFF